MTYSSSLAMGRARIAQKNQNTTSFRVQERTLGPISNTIILIVLACVLGLLYLTQVTKTNAYGYKIDSLNKQQTELKQAHDELAVSSARLQSLSRVKDSQVAKSMVNTAPAGTLTN